jgi:hypothetical protein
MYYHGTTSLLTIKLRVVGSKINVKATADKEYRKLSKYKKLIKLLPQGKNDKLRKAFRDYMSRAIRKANPKWYHNGKEGYWQNRLCIEWGRRSLPSEKYMVIDRECVIGFGPGGRDKPYDSVFERYAEIRERLQKSSPNYFGKFRTKSLGDNLDMLAQDEQGNLVVIELKHGSNVTGIYWGPLQVLAYRDAFKMELGEIAQDIKDLVSQKVNLGLLPHAAMTRLPDGKFSSVEAVLVIAEPIPKSKCWKKLDRVIFETKAFQSIEDWDNIRIVALK